MEKLQTPHMNSSHTFITPFNETAAQSQVYDEFLVRNPAHAILTPHESDLPFAEKMLF
jgi:hypothetical protein